MNDKDKMVVNTEEQNRTINPGDTEIQEESVSQDPVKSTSDAKNEGKRQEEKTRGEE